MEAPGSADVQMDTEGSRETFIRVTNHGKMRSWIAFSLNFFASDGEKRLILHTLPSAVDPDVESDRQPPPSVTAKEASTATSVTPRLISVVEVVKREFIKNLEKDRSPRLKGLHQYNEILTLEELGVTVKPSRAKEGQENPTETEENTRSQQILQALSGKHQLVSSVHPTIPPFHCLFFSSQSPRQTQSPFLRITLSLVELPDLLLRGATYQPPIIRKVSKSAKMRAKKRAKSALAKQTTAGAAPAGN
ncbi:hypothetical protein M413DRAFT_325570 [Hebeloma cylindrosporum]|uniref:Uncharacterized protein n=1 Tax=Hebeloma cylindrosporum TaxID=76867 RepID=A0A0C3BWS8_HEBCY|nr:hypothetical protein M413DRAFT_325570 [Hebeloma cylindrosporum h7]